jgi:lipoate-protein ligase A
MALSVRPYDLEDAYLFGQSGDGYLVWQPGEYQIVLGQSNTAENSLITENVIRDSVPVTKRPSGGEAVILTPSTIAFTVSKAFSVSVPFRDFFRTVNSLVIDCLADLGVANLSSNGISDITIGNKKILGSSMRNTHGCLIYHAVLNVSEDPGLFEKYLRHPGREPGYRTGRSHSEFVTSLKAEGYDLKPGVLIPALEEKLHEYLSGS